MSEGGEEEMEKKIVYGSKGKQCRREVSGRDGILE